MKKSSTLIYGIIFILISVAIVKALPVIGIVIAILAGIFVIYLIIVLISKLRQNIRYKKAEVDINKTEDFLITDFVVIDLETTGLRSYEDEIIQIGALKVQNLQIVDKFNEYVKPDCVIPKNITALTHINNATVQNAENIYSVLPKFKNFIGDSMLVAHNASFDVSFLSTAYRNVFGTTIMNKYIDTLAISRAVFQDMPNHKLSTLIATLHLNAKNTHDALSDCYGAYQLFLAENKKLVSLNMSLSPFYNENSDIRFSDLKCQNDNIDTSNPFYKKTCVLFEVDNKIATAQKILNLGGVVRIAPSTRTNWFIVGDYSYLNLKSSSLEKLKTAQERGADIKIINYNEFNEICNRFL